MRHPPPAICQNCWWPTRHHYLSKPGGGGGGGLGGVAYKPPREHPSGENGAVLLLHHLGLDLGTSSGVMSRLTSLAQAFGGGGGERSRGAVTKGPSMCIECGCIRVKHCGILPIGLDGDTPTCDTRHHAKKGCGTPGITSML